METTKFAYTWVLWYFDPRNKSWDLVNYKKIADMATPQQLWTVFNAIPREAWEYGYFFFMRRGFRPVWEVPENENGGSWSKKVPTAELYDTVLDLIAHSVTNQVVPSRPETLVGFSTSPKGEHNVVKLWNTSSTLHKRDLLNAQIPSFKITEDVAYTPHRARGY
jgi:hypothetical protein